MGGGMGSHLGGVGVVKGGGVGITSLIYIKNKNFEINEIILYERFKNEKFNFKHIKIIEAQI